MDDDIKLKLHTFLTSAAGVREWSALGVERATDNH
jgi:hypothetical protein